MVCYGRKATKGGGVGWGLQNPIPERHRPQGATAAFPVLAFAWPLMGTAVNNISPSFSKLQEAYKLNAVFVVCSCTLSSVLSSLIILIKA